MITTIIRVFIIYTVVLLVFRLMGKRQIGQMQPFEFVLTLIIADLATLPMSEISIPILNGIVPLLTLVVFHFVLTSLTRISTKFSNFISGKPVIVIDRSGINYKSLKQLNITIDDLFEAIRGQGYFSFSEVEYAIMETTGTVSVMPKPAFSPVTKADMQIKEQSDTLPLTIITEGEYMQDNLNLSHKPKEFFDNLLKKLNVKSVKQVLILTITKGGEVFFQEKEKECKVFNV
ncbi:MAG: DUF421 domain-containing protein [Clostridia bacterium]|nr:DUF421 domain-containing protein [Clostridia bacterium]